MNGKGAEVTCAIRIPGKASISSVSPQDGCNFLLVSVGLRPAVEILLQTSSKRSCRTKIARSSRGTPGGTQAEGEQGAKAVVIAVSGRL